MKTQEMFDKVVTHLLTQKARSLGPGPTGAMWAMLMQSGGSTCLYRNDEGLKCAAGCLIPEDKYHPSMETVSVEGLPFFQDLCEDGDKQLALLRKCQEVHDQIEIPDWEMTIKYLAAVYKLQFNWGKA